MYMNSMTIVSIFLVGTASLHAGQVTLPDIQKKSASSFSAQEEQIMRAQIVQGAVTRVYQRLEKLPTYDDAICLYQISKTLIENNTQKSQSLNDMVKSVEQCTPHYLFWKKNIASKHLFLARGKILTILLPEPETQKILQEKLPYYFDEEQAKNAAEKLDNHRNNINKVQEAVINNPALSPQTLITKFPILTSPKRYALWQGKSSGL